MRIDFENFYTQHIKPCLSQPWVRADTRRVLQRLSLLGSRHRIHLKTYDRLRRAKETETILNTMARDLLVLPFMVGLKVGIHNGRAYPVVIISPRHIGYRLGEFAYPKREVHNHTSKTRIKEVKK